MSSPPHTTTRIWIKTLKKFKAIGELTEESMIYTMERLAQGELERIRKEEPTAISQSFHGVTIPSDKN